MRATDPVGNTDASSASYTWLVDTTAPSSTVTFPVASATYNTAGWNSGCATSGLCGTYGDGTGAGVAEVEISIRQGSGDYWNGTAFSSGAEIWNDASLSTGNWSLAFAAGNFPADGGYTVRVRAVDAVANAQTPSSRTFTIDRDGPETSIDSNPVHPTASTSATFTFSSDEGGSTFECRIDGGAWGACTTPRNYTTLSDGSHTFDVRATDVAGNTDATPASYTWLVDTSAPSSTATFPTASDSYTAAEWDAGCPATGLCGTYTDGSGSGVAEVEISIRQGSGNYWNGTAFASATEVWNDDHPRRGRLDLRVPGRQLPRRQQLHHPRPRPRRRRQHRVAVEPNIRDRHHGAELRDRLPRRFRRLQRRRMGRGLCRRRPLRHLLRRHLRRRRGRGLHPPGLGRLLGRQRLHERHRGLERRRPRRRRLGLRLRRRRLPRRRELHGARPRPRHRRERPGGVESDLHL